MSNGHNVSDEATDKNRIDLSIVIVNWNTIDLLRDLLTSVFSNVGNLLVQVIVIDNASSDGSSAMVDQEFPQVTLLQNTNNLGFAAANNQGFSIATGRHVLMLNSDTIILGNVLESSVAFLDSRTEVGAIGCRVLNPDQTMQRTCSMWPSKVNLALQTSGLWRLSYPKFFGRYLMTAWKRDSEREVDSISGCYLMTRYKVLEQVGELDEAFFFFGEETDWCRRVRSAGWKLVFTPLGEIVHYGSVSAKKLNHKRDILLTSATVMLHSKHEGRLSAFFVWVILLIHNLSRAFLWGIRAIFQRSPEARERAVHFRRVVFGQINLIFGR